MEDIFVLWVELDALVWTVLTYGPDIKVAYIFN